VAEKYHIGFDNLRKLVVSYAAKTGMVAEVPKPKPTTQPKNQAGEAAKKAQRLLITWLSEEPKLYRKIKKYITPKDFKDELYFRVAERMFAEMEQGVLNPAGIVSMFTDEEEQRQVAALFNTKLEQLESRQDREKAFHDIVVNVKKFSYEQDSEKLGSDMSALARVIEGKKALEELERTHISLD